jgi:hypothetical protein
MRSALCALVLACSLFVHPVARADTVADWNDIAVDAIVRSGEHIEYTLRAMAMVHVAMFEALNFVQGRYTAHFVVESPILNEISLDAVAAAAAQHVLVDLYPNQRATFDTALEISVNARASHETRAGRTIGSSIGGVISAVRALQKAGDAAPPASTTFPVTSLQAKPPATMELWLARSAEHLLAADRSDPQGAHGMRLPVGERRSGGQPRLAQTSSLIDPLSWNPMIAELIARKGLSPIERARIHALVSMAVADAYTIARASRYPCAPCIATTAVATILESELGGGRTTDRGLDVHRQMGRAIAEQALRFYFRPTVRPRAD